MKCLKYKIVGVFIFLVQFAIAQSGTTVKGNVSISAGFSDRKIEKSAKIETVNSNVAGKVCVSVCIDSNGNISRATFQPQGSTTISKELVTAAIKNAESYKFVASTLQKQCGQFIYNFTAQ